MRPSPSALVGIVVAAAALVGCGGDSDGAESVTETVASTVETTESTETTERTETTTAATEPPVATEPPPDGAVGG